MTNGFLRGLLDETRFARFVGNIYAPRRPSKQRVYSHKERLWLFLTIRIEVEKKRLSYLKFAKNFMTEE
ncbi:MAG: hypothetical protein FWE22_08185 [Firmicutes bacterium]|nr:hypothetical protein [Bacillota bacterium]